MCSSSAREQSKKKLRLTGIVVQPFLHFSSKSFRAGVVGFQVPPKAFSKIGSVTIYFDSLSFVGATRML